MRRNRQSKHDEEMMEIMREQERQAQEQIWAGEHWLFAQQHPELTLSDACIIADIAGTERPDTIEKAEEYMSR